MTKPEPQASAGRAVSPDSRHAELGHSRRRSDVGVPTRTQSAANRLLLPRASPAIVSPALAQTLSDTTLLPHPGTRHVEQGRNDKETRVRTQSATRADDRQSRRDPYDITDAFVRDRRDDLGRYGNGPRRALRQRDHGLDFAREPAGWNTTPIITQPDPLAYGGNPNSSGVRLSVSTFDSIEQRQHKHTRDLPGGPRPKRYAYVDEESTSSAADSESDSDSGRVPYSFMTTQDSQESDATDQNAGLQPQVSNASVAYRAIQRPPVTGIKTSLTHRRVSHSLHKKEESPGSAIAPAHLFVHESEKGKTEKEPEHLFQWYELEVDQLDFTHFKKAVLEIEPLSGLRREEVQRHLDDAQIQFERELRVLPGIRGRVMESSCSTDATVGEDQNILRKMTLLCLPFFSLEQYKEDRLTALDHTSTIHPLRTLLQSQYSHVPSSRDRDQAAWKLRPEEGKCFHVNQVWCLLVDDSLLITCSTMSLSSLLGDMVRFERRPPRRAEEQHTRDPPIHVTDCCNRLWLFEVHECPTWLSFTAHFLEVSREFDDDFALHLANSGEQDMPDREIGAENWALVLNSAQSGIVRLALSRREIGERHQPKHVPATTPTKQAFTMKSKQESRPNFHRRAQGSKDGLTKDWARNQAPNSPMRQEPDRPRSPAGSTQLIDDFCIFAWPIPKVQDSSTEDKQRVQQSLREAHQHLESQTNVKDQVAFQQCSKLSYDDINKWATTRTVFKGQLPTKGARDVQRIQKTKLKVALAARDLFNFFFQLGSKEAIAQKFWGALHDILEVEHRLVDLTQFYTQLHGLARLAIHLTKQMQALSGQRTAVKNPPAEFINACLHSLMFMIHFKSAKTATQHYAAARSLLLGGKMIIQNQIRDKPLQEREAALPLGVVSLIVRRLLNDVTDKGPITDTYFEYFARLDGQVRRDCLKRIHQQALSLSLQEIEAVIANCMDQWHALLHFSLAINQGTDDFSSGQGRGASLVDECVRSSLDRLETFRELAQQTRDLGQYNLNMIATNKDRQEQAVVAFTIVTIVFLPLSFVASFLGMNTKDLRESDKGEYLFRCSAVPLTAVILTTVLHWTGEVNFFQLIQRLGRWIARGLRSEHSDEDLDLASPTAVQSTPMYSPPPPVTAPQALSPPMLRRHSNHGQYHVTRAASWEQDIVTKTVAQAFIDGLKTRETQSDVRMVSQEEKAAMSLKRAVRRRRARGSSLKTLDEDTQDSSK